MAMADMITRNPRAKGALHERACRGALRRPFELQDARRRAGAFGRSVHLSGAGTDDPARVCGENALGRQNMLDLDVNSLLNDAVSHLLVDLNANRSLSHIKNNSSATMISLERHTLMASSVGYNINVVTNMVGAHESRERNHSMAAECSLEHVTSTGTITVSVRHCLHKISSTILQIFQTLTKTCFLRNLEFPRKR